MTIPYTRISLSLALLLGVSNPLLGDDVPVPVDPGAGSQVVPSAPTPAPSAVPHLSPETEVPATPAPYVGGGAPGGDPISGMRVGQPYYWSASGPGAYGPGAFGPQGPGYGSAGYGPGGGSGCGCQGGGGSYGGAGYAGPAYGGPAYGGPGYGGPAYGAQGYAGVGFYGNGYGSGNGFRGNPYYTHFGPGFYRNSDTGYARFPWYSYRRPWYYTGHPSYNRDTNLPW